MFRVLWTEFLNLHLTIGWFMRIAAAEFLRQFEVAVAEPEHSYVCFKLKVDDSVVPKLAQTMLSHGKIWERVVERGDLTEDELLSQLCTSLCAAVEVTHCSHTLPLKGCKDLSSFVETVISRTVDTVNRSMMPCPDIQKRRHIENGLKDMHRQFLHFTFNVSTDDLVYVDQLQGLHYAIDNNPSFLEIINYEKLTCAEYQEKYPRTSRDFFETFITAQQVKRKIDDSSEDKLDF